MMLAHERELLVAQLTTSEEQLLGLVAELTPAQWRFHEAPERWSILEIVEHLVVFEGFIRGAIANTLMGGPEPEKAALAAEKESLALGLSKSRGSKLQAREATRPAGRWKDEDELVAELRKARAETLRFAAATEEDLRTHFFPHIAFGDLDCYQWLVVVAQHTLRHCAQIKEVMRDESFPAA